MPCDWLRMKDGTVVHLHYGSGGKKKTCPFCKRGKVDKLCDYPIGHGKTCDAGMCSQCATTIGRQNTHIGLGMQRLGDTTDVCPIHDGKPWPSAANDAPADAGTTEGDAAV